MSRTGKIARLPHHVRDELNRRLEANVPGRILVAWLNSLPEVQEVLRDLFSGTPVSEQNLSQWRRGGFLEWQTRKDLLECFRETARDAADFEETGSVMADHAARLLAFRFADALAHWNGDPESPAIENLRRLSPLVRSVTSLRRGEQTATGLKMEQHAFALASGDRHPGEATKAPPDPLWSAVPASPNPESPAGESVRPPRESHHITPNHTGVPQPLIPRTALPKSNPLISQSLPSSFPPASRTQIARSA